MGGAFDVRTEHVVAVAAALLVVTPSTAYAYIDPGSGTLLWQLLLAAFFGALFWLRRAWVHIRSVMSRVYAGIRDRGPKNG